jgi:hypothetical protein
VYILAEIRKLLELRQEKKKYFALNFYTAGRFTPKWTRLEQNEFSKDSTGLMRRLSARANRISKTYPSLFAGNSETMVYAKFREQLEAYLKLHSLSREITLRDFKWSQFLGLYSEIIEECPLELAGQGIKLPHITKVTVFKIRQLPDSPTLNGIVVFGTAWRLSCVDPRQNGSWSMWFTVPLTPIFST